MTSGGVYLSAARVCPTRTPALSFFLFFFVTSTALHTHEGGASCFSFSFCWHFAGSVFIVLYAC